MLSLRCFQRTILFSICLCAIVLQLSCGNRQLSVEKILDKYDENGNYGILSIEYPLEGTVFPPEMPSPTFKWKDGNPQSDTWVVTISFEGGGDPVNVLASSSEWVPADELWETIKSRSSEKSARVTVIGVGRSAPGSILSRGKTTFGTSKDEVGAPIMYREVNLPFIDAVKDPSKIRWRFGPVSSKEAPPIVLDNLPVCGNCHSFSSDGNYMGMDVDYANDKGSYAFTKVGEEILLNSNSIVTWADYKPEDGELTFGLLSQVSPDGRYAISTVKDRSVFVPKDDIAFSQLFFPLKGILCVYDRVTGQYTALPGADDPEYVQSNPTWSPDGRYIVFARSKAYQLSSIGNTGKILLTPEECDEFLTKGKTFLFDLYRIPFNDGKGGIPEPIKGASDNGVSNFFARYSPDGKWIVFCKAKSFMLLQPDSELYIVPAEGGEARRLRCNTNKMNSWHSWSPNGWWIVFSSKQNGPFTQLFLTHVDEAGETTPPVLLSRFTASDRAANIPEFVNAGPTAIRKIREQYVDDVSFVRAAFEHRKAGDLDSAMTAARKALEINPKSAKAFFEVAWISEHQGKMPEAIDNYRKALELDTGGSEPMGNLGVCLIKTGSIREGIEYLEKAVALEPKNPMLRYNIGLAYSQTDRIDQAIRFCKDAVALKEDYADAQAFLVVLYMRKDMLDVAFEHLALALRADPKRVGANYNMGIVNARLGKMDKAIELFRYVIELDPNHADAYYDLARAFANTGNLAESTKCFAQSLKIKPELAADTTYLNLLRDIGVPLETVRTAVSSVEDAAKRASASGNQELAAKIQANFKAFAATLSR